RRQVRDLSRVARRGGTQEAGVRDSDGDAGKLLCRAGVPPCLRQRLWAAHQGGEMAGRVSDDHVGLRLSVGGHRAERLNRGLANKALAMVRFIIRRTLYAIVTLFILSLTIFTVIRLTGDPVTLMAEPGARAEDLDRVRAEWGLDRPLPVQYLSFLKNIVTGEL